MKTKTLIFRNTFILFLCLITLALLSVCMCGVNGTSARAETVTQTILIDDEYIIEGYEDGVTTVSDPENNAVSIFNARFIASKLGTYTIKVNKNNKIVLKVLSSVPTVDFAFTHTLMADYAVGETIKLPLLTASSSLQEEISYSIIVERNRKIINEFTDINGFQYLNLDREDKFTIFYRVVDTLGYVSSRNFSFTVTKKPVILTKDIPTFIPINTVFDFETPVALNDGKKVKAVITVKDPQNNVVELVNNKFNPDKVGVYTVIITAPIDGLEAKTFLIDVNFSADSLFKASEGVILNANVPLPANALEPKTGLLMVAKTNGSSVTFKNVLNFNNISKDTNVVSFFAVTDDEMNQIKIVEIKFTDIHNRKNNFTLRYKISIVEETQDGSYADVSYKGTTLGRNNEKAFITAKDPEGKMFVNSVNYGTRVRDNSLDSKNFRNLVEFSMQLDYKERQVWVNSGNDTECTGNEIVVPGKNKRKAMVVDLDRADHVGAENAWQGFTTGEAEVSISIPSVSGKAGLIITEIAGQSLAGKTLLDSSAPELIVDIDKDNLVGDRLPAGQVNMAYPIPKAEGIDLISGHVDANVKLMKGDVDLTNKISNNSVLLGEAGEYKLVYCAQDASNNIKTQTFNFEIKSTFAELDCSMASADIMINSLFTVPKPVITNASGKVTVSEIIKYNGKNIILDVSRTIAIKVPSPIKIKITAVDYIGRKIEKEFTYTVSASGIVVSVPSMPEKLICGETITLPDFIAIDTDVAFGLPGYNMNKSIKVNNKTLGENREFTVPTTEGNFNVTFTGSYGAKTKSQTVQINAVKPTSLADYFTFDSNKISTLVHENGLNFTSSDSLQNISVPYALIAQNLIIKLSVLKENANLDYFDITLSDYSLRDKNIVLRIYRGVYVEASGQIAAHYEDSDSKSTLIINPSIANSKRITINGSCTNNEMPILLSFNNELKRLEYTDNKMIAKIDTFSNGSIFNGFEDSLIKMDIGFGNLAAQKTATIKLIQISNQAFNTTSWADGSDSKGAEILFAEEFNAKKAMIGDTISLPMAYAYDVLSFMSSVTVKVTSPDKIILLNNVQCDKVNTFILEKYGIYKIEYLATDAYGNPTKKTLQIKVLDTIAPIITVLPEFKDTYSLNSEINLIPISATDNFDEKCQQYIMVISPDGQLNIVDSGSYKLAQYGNYIIVYYARDDAMNVTRLEFKLMVK